jgi:hypothetical protein
MSAAMDEVGLKSALFAWDVDGPEANFPAYIKRLAPAVIELVDMGLIQLYRPEADDSGPSLNRDEVARVVANPKAWWNGIEPLEEMVWLVLTDEGQELLFPVPEEELERFYRHH